MWAQFAIENWLIIWKNWKWIVKLFDLSFGKEPNDWFFVVWLFLAVLEIPWALWRIYGQKPSKSWFWNGYMAIIPLGFCVLWKVRLLFTKYTALLTAFFHYNFRPKLFFFSLVVAVLCCHQNCVACHENFVFFQRYCLVHRIFSQFAMQMLLVRVEWKHYEMCSQMQPNTV